METFTKELSKSEAKNKIIIKTKGYSISTIKEGGGQASINIPGDFMEYALENNILVSDPEIEKMLFENDNSYNYNVLSLNSSYQLFFDEKLKHLLNINDTINLGFFVISGEQTKYQIRPKLFNIIDKVSEKDFSWLKAFIDKSTHFSEIKFISNIDEKSLTISYNTKIIEQINILDDSNIENDYIVPMPKQVLYFGAPGTGKSYNISKIIREHSWIEIPNEINVDDLNNVFRSTMFAEYSYFDFIGSVMPSVSEERITYDFIPGPFTKALSYAFKYPKQPVYLVLEEMSRANMASVFGDIFQLLDREPNGESTFKINNDLIAQELSLVDKRFLDIQSGELEKIYLPPNFSILGTVNSNDQNVFVMDTAFKRRFDFIYISTSPVYNEKGEILNNFKFLLHGKEIEWIPFYTSLNKFILQNAKLNEDKQIGQFFIKGSINESDSIAINTERIKNKLLNYLWLDVNTAIFTGEKIFNIDYHSFYEIYDDFEKNDKNIFSLNLEVK